MWNWQNNRVCEGKGEPYSRFIASWVVANDKRWIFGDTFKDWLRSLDLTEDEIHDIYEMATCGKMEMEGNAKNFISKHVHSYVDEYTNKALDK